jgi:tRNA-dihydrouridine synthase A
MTPAHRLACRLSVAPMMAWTDRHCRYFHRLLAPQSLLYTEMVTTGALLHGDVDRHLFFRVQEGVVALQLGGNDPEALARSAELAQGYGYAEVNLNVGCPSDRVQNGAFGACLMKQPEVVAAGVRAMREAVDLPVTVKCRIGVDELDDEAYFRRFAESVRDAGADALIVHARKAWLKGLSPKQNREVPPLDYPRVWRLKADHPDWPIMINGGIDTLAAVREQLSNTDGGMIGRAAYQRPWFLAEAHAAVYDTALPDAYAVVEAMSEYAEEEARLRDVRVQHIARHMLGLFHGLPGGKRWRQVLSEGAHRDDAAAGILLQALEEVVSRQAA